MQEDEGTQLVGMEGSHKRCGRSNGFFLLIFVACLFPAAAFRLVRRPKPRGCCSCRPAATTCCHVTLHVFPETAEH